MRRVIGLDFGSSQSLVAVMEIGTTQEPEIVRFDADNEVSRTLLALDINDNHLVAAGNDVWDMLKDRGRKDFRVVRDFKRYLGETMSPEEGENLEVTSADLFCKNFLSELCKKLRKYFNVEQLSKDNFSTCVAHPATWDERKIQLLVNMIQEVGFPDVHAIAEPLAAVYATMKQHDKQFEDKAEHYLVVDFGGGTLDVCIVEIGILGRFAKIVSRSGNPKLGGREFDKIIETQYLRNANLTKTILSSRDRTYIREESETQKKLISANMATGCTQFTCIFQTPSQSMLPVMRDDIINWSRDSGIWQQYCECIDEALKKSGLDITQISRVILTGGSSQWWFLKDIFTSEENGYGMDTNRVILTKEPHTDVCIGCAIHAGYAENRELIPGIWIKYRIGHYEDADKGWTELQQLKAPALPGKQAAKEQKYLTCLPKSKSFSPYRVEFKWFSGISESDLKAVDEDTGVVEIYARSNKGVLNTLFTPLRWVSKKIVQANGDEVKEKNDTYVLYIQMQETAAKNHYKLLVMDVEAQEYERSKRAIDDNDEVPKCPPGKRTECEVEPGYISRCGFMGLATRKLTKK